MKKRRKQWGRLSSIRELPLPEVVRYGLALGLKGTEIAHELGISPQKVSRIKVRSLDEYDFGSVTDLREEI